ncbi:ASCH/PUA domain-containing protein [Aeromonas hydrophila]
MKHELKIKPEYFSAVFFGEKTFEIRNNADRNFQVGDTLVLKAWDGEFTGDFVEKVVSYITDFEQKPGYVVLGLANKREQELAEQLADATRQCGVMAELLREVTRIVPAIGVAIDDLPVVDAFLERVEMVLDGKMPDRHDTEWTDATTSPVAADYRELQEQHDALQSKYKAAQNLVRDIVGFDRELDGDDGIGTMADRIDALLADQLPDPAVTVTETIRTAPERIWLQVGDQAHCHSEPFPRDTGEVTWCADSVVGCEVPYVRADLAAPAVLQGGEPCASVPPLSSKA